jgi:type I restriction enzyme M protein
VSQLAVLPIPIPAGLSPHGIEEQLADLDSAIEATLSLLSDLEATRDGRFTASDSDELADRLRDSAETGRVFLGVVDRVQDPAARLRDTLPYPIARAIRAHDIAGDDLQRYEAVLGIAEATAITLGAIGLAWSVETRADIDAQSEWRTKLWRGGVSLGHWIAVANDAARAARSAGDPVGGFANALRDRRGGRGLRSDLEALVRERNDARHGGAGPRTRAEALQRISDRSLNLSGLLEGVAFLAGLPFWLVERITLRADGMFDVRALRLMGDHPEFEPTVFQSAAALRDGELYVELAPDRQMALWPSFSWFDCPSCRRPEVYFVDRVQSPTARLKSFDRGHPYASQEVAERLAALGLGPV